MIKKIFPKIIEKVGLSDYNYPQKYSSTMEIILENTGKTTQKINLISPLPLKKYQQNLLTKLIINTAGNIQTEPKYCNQYICWKDEIKKGESKTFSYQFDISTNPINIPIDPSYVIDNYNHDHNNLKWLAPNKHLNSSSLNIHRLAQEIVGNEANILNIVLRFSDYIKENLEYGNPISGLYTDKDCLKNNVVDCGGFSTLFISLCQSMGIPARLVAGYWSDRPHREMHAWAEFMLPNETWVPVDLSIEQLRKANRESKFAAMGKLGSDRIAMSYGCDFKILEHTNEETLVDILQTPFIIPKNKDIKIEYKLDSTINK